MRNFINITESFSPRQINISEEYGSIDGYTISSEAVQLENWLSKNSVNNKKLVDDIRSKYKIVSFLDNLNVNEDSRNEVNGSYLFDLFKEQAMYQGANAILLIADIAEENDFNLADWYKRLGFKIICKTASGPLMLLKI